MRIHIFAAVLVIGLNTLGSGTPAQADEIFNTEVEKLMHRLPELWEGVVPKAISRTWSENTSKCFEKAELRIIDHMDPLIVFYDENEIVLSRGYMGDFIQASGFAFYTMLGAIPDDALSSLIEHHDAALEDRSLAYLAYRHGTGPVPPLFMDSHYLFPFHSKVAEIGASMSMEQVVYAANRLTGAAVLFAMLHEVGHHLYQSCPDSVSIDPSLPSDAWADQFAIQTFDTEDFAILMAVDAIRIMHAYKAQDQDTAQGSLRCRVSKSVDRLKPPQPDMFTIEGLYAPDAAMLAQNLARLLPLYKLRYQTDGC